MTGEVEGMHRWLGDPIVNRYLSWGTSSLAETNAHFQQVIESQRHSPRKQYFLAIELNASKGRSIGDTGFIWVAPEVAEIGYFLLSAPNAAMLAANSSPSQDLSSSLRVDLVASDKPTLKFHWGRMNERQ